MPADTIALAQLSDVHIGPLPHLPLRLLNLKRLTGFLNWHRKRRFMHLPDIANRLAADVVAQHPTHIAVTGDLANIGLPEEITRGAAWLQKLGTPANVSVIPGNHDIYSTIGGRKLGAAALTPWTPYFASDAAGARYANPTATFPFVRILDGGTLRVALIGLNSAVETPPVVATGALGAAQLQRLAGILDATHRDGLVRVVMLHHPPLPGGADARHALTDAADMAEVLRRHGAELVIHGHNHRASITPFEGAHGRMSIVGVPSASMAVRSSKGENLARAHLFQFTPGDGGAAARITLIARGFAEPDGPVIELERRVL